LSREKISIIDNVDNDWDGVTHDDYDCDNNISKAENGAEKNCDDKGRLTVMVHMKFL